MHWNCLNIYIVESQSYEYEKSPGSSGMPGKMLGQVYIFLLNFQPLPSLRRPKRWDSRLWHHTPQSWFFYCGKGSVRNSSGKVSCSLVFIQKDLIFIPDRGLSRKRHLFFLPFFVRQEFFFFSLVRVILESVIRVLYQHTALGLLLLWWNALPKAKELGKEKVCLSCISSEVVWTGIWRGRARGAASWLPSYSLLS